jgi:hypothetical protein
LNKYCPSQHNLLFCCIYLLCSGKMKRMAVQVHGNKFHEIFDISNPSQAIFQKSPYELNVLSRVVVPISNTLTYLHLVPIYVERKFVPMAYANSSVVSNLVSVKENSFFYSSLQIFVMTGNIKIYNKIWENHTGYSLLPLLTCVQDVWENIFDFRRHSRTSSYDLITVGHLLSD